MKIVLLIIYLLLVLTVIFLERKKPTEALLWVLILICIPYVGIILYLVFGSTMAIKITANVRKKRLIKYYNNIDEKKEEALDYLKISDEDMQVINFNKMYNTSELTSYKDINVYTNGMDHYNKLFEDIKNAKNDIYVEFYTIHNDEVGHAFVKSLTEKAKEGLTVFVMCDFVANMGVPPKMFRPLKKAGGKVIRVKPFFTHYRSHRKIVVIDHEISYIGGMNIGKKYINRSKKKNPWRDTQVRMTGASANVLDKYFLTDWICSIKRKNWDQTIDYINKIKPSTTLHTNNFCQFIVGGVDTRKESVKMCYLSMIRSAKKRIRIQTPYFIPDASILDALKTAAATGIEIELMIPGVKSSFFLDPVTTYYCGELFDYNIKVYKYNGYVHAKTLIIDDEICCIGSVNMDIRSLQVDDEICGVFYQNNFVSNYSNIFDQDIKSSILYTKEEFLKRGPLEKLSEGFFLLFAPLM